MVTNPANPFNRAKYLNENDKPVCPMCRVDIDTNAFTDDLSRKEWEISGLCQGCQDGFFD